MVLCIFLLDRTLTHTSILIVFDILYFYNNSVKIYDNLSYYVDIGNNTTGHCSHHHFVQFKFLAPAIFLSHLDLILQLSRMLYELQHAFPESAGLQTARIMLLSHQDQFPRPSRMH